MDQKNRRKNKMARQKTDITWTRDPYELNSFPVPYCNEKKKTNTQIINLVKEIKILRTKSFIKCA